MSLGQIKNLIINIPPGHMKSLILAVFWPSWEWIERPGFRFLGSSYSQELGLRDTQRARDLMRSPWYRNTFGIEWEFDPDQDAKGYYLNSAKGFRITITPGSKTTGYRGDCIFVDDPLNTTEQNSKTTLEQCIFWWDKAMSSRLNDMSTGRKIIMMQRLHENDLSGHAIRSGGYELLRLPSRYEVAEKCRTFAIMNGERQLFFEDPRTREGQILFPAKFPEKVLQEAQNTLQADFAGQHQQRPTSAEGEILLKEWWNFWEPEEENLQPVLLQIGGRKVEKKPVKLPALFHAKIQSWDLSFKDLQSSDFVVGQVQAVRGTRKFVLDQVRGHWGAPRSAQEIVKMRDKHPDVSGIFIEDKANGPAVMQMLRGTISGIIAVEPEGGKESRIAGASLQAEAGEWYLPHPDIAPWVWGFIGECASFPRGQYDDQPDAWSQGAIRLKKMSAGIMAFYANEIEKKEKAAIAEAHAA